MASPKTKQVTNPQYENLEVALALLPTGLSVQDFIEQAAEQGFTFTAKEIAYMVVGCCYENGGTGPAACTMGTSLRPTTRTMTVPVSQPVKAKSESMADDGAAYRKAMYGTEWYDV